MKIELTLKVTDEATGVVTGDVLYTERNVSMAKTLSIQQALVKLLNDRIEVEKKKLK